MGKVLKLNILHSLILGEQGEDLLILHGFLGMGDNWKTYAKRLTPHGFRVHLVDQRNHGRSFWDPKFSYSKSQIIYIYFNQIYAQY